MSKTEWKEVRLGDFVQFQNGFAFKSSDFKEFGDYKVVKIKELKDGLVKFFDDTACVSATNISEKYVLKNGDVIFALTGDPVSKPNPSSWVGRVSIYNKNIPAVLNQRTCKIICSNKIDSTFLYYHFRLWENFYLLASKATGSASQANISTNTIADTIISLPPLAEQQRIAKILLSLDDKIELNNAINRNLEEQAQAIFKNWFIDFEPFGGEMPEDWQTGKLSDIAEYEKDKIDVAKLNAETYYSTENMLPNKVGVSKAASLPTTEQTTRCIPGETIISNIRPYFKKIFYCTEEIAGCSADVLCFKPKKESFSIYNYDLLYSDNFFDYMVKGSKGTKMPRGDKSQIMNYDVVIPAESVISDFNNVVSNILQQISNNKKENECLAKLRDTLLPDLMSGELCLNT